MKTQMTPPAIVSGERIAHFSVSSNMQRIVNAMIDKYHFHLSLTNSNGWTCNINYYPTNDVSVDCSASDDNCDNAIAKTIRRFLDNSGRLFIDIPDEEKAILDPILNRIDASAMDKPIPPLPENG